MPDSPFMQGYWSCYTMMVLSRVGELWVYSWVCQINSLSHPSFEYHDFIARMFKIGFWSASLRQVAWLCKLRVWVNTSEGSKRLQLVDSEEVSRINRSVHSPLRSTSLLLPQEALLQYDICWCSSAIWPLIRLAIVLPTFVWVRKSREDLYDCFYWIFNMLYTGTSRPLVLVILTFITFFTLVSSQHRDAPTVWNASLSSTLPVEFSLFRRLDKGTCDSTTPCVGGECCDGKSWVPVTALGLNDWFFTYWP